MAAIERWYFDLEHIHSTPSIKCGYDHDKELSCRQQAANFIQDMGQRLQVNQLCINTAIVYMHRFYMFHSFQRFHRTSLASAALFLAAKVEEQPRKLEHVIRFAQICLHRDQIPFDVNSQSYMEQVQDLIMNENILLQTLGFDVAIDHPHTHIVRCCQLVRASKDLAQTSYFMASYSLHLTTMCLQYKPTVVACFCIHLACKWSNWEIPESSEGKPWFWYVDKTVTSELLENLTSEFLNLFEKCPSRLKKKIMALSTYSNLPPGISNPQPVGPPQMNANQQDSEKKKENRLTIESHNPINTVPHPIGPMGVAVAEANALSNTNMPSGNTGPHPFLHQNPMGSRHVNSEGMMKKHHYEHSQRSVGPPIPNILPPPSLSVDSYKKLHHLPHHQRESHMAIAPGSSSSSNKSSCMFDNSLVQPAPQHKPYQQHAHINAAVVHPPPPPAPNSRANNHVPQSHRTQSSRPPHIRNGEAHFPDKKFPLDVKREQIDSKPPQMLAPPVQVPPRMKPKTPPPQLNLTTSVAPPPVKIERSIFSPDEKTISPPQVRVQEKIKSSPPPTPRTPVEIKKDSPHSDVEQPAPIVPPAAPLPPDNRTKESTSINTGDNSRERVCGSPPPPAPDTPSKSSHIKKKKKKHKDHKDKHKDKHKHKHRLKDPEPIVITIPKDKITISHPEGLKIKIAKEKISNPPSGLKLKISKDKLKESKKRDRSDCEDDDSEQPSKQHRPNGTTALQVTRSNNFSSVLGESILSPIGTPSFSNKYDSSPPLSPVQIPKYSPTKSGDSKCSVRTPGYCLSNESRYNPSPTKPCLSPIAATPLHRSGLSPEHEPHSPDRSNLLSERETTVSPLHNKPFLSPIAATPRRFSKSHKSPSVQLELFKSTPVTDLSHMSPMRNKPFLSPIAATPRHVPKTKSFKSPFRAPHNSDLPTKDSEMSHLSPIRSKPFLSPLAPTPMHTSKTKTFKSPPACHVYVPMAKLQQKVTDLSYMSPVRSKPFLSPIAPTPRYPSPKHKASPPQRHCYVPMKSLSESCNSSSPSSSSRSSLGESDDEDCLDKNLIGSQIKLTESTIPLDDDHCTGPVLTPGHNTDYRENKLVSPIQTPAHYTSKIRTPNYVPDECRKSLLHSKNDDFDEDNVESNKSPPYDPNQIEPLSFKSGLRSDSYHDSELLSPKLLSDETGTDDSDKESSEVARLPKFSTKLKLSPMSSSSQSPICQRFKDPTYPNRTPSPINTDHPIQQISNYLEFNPYNSRSECSSPINTLESTGKCLLSPIMTPGRSPVRRESSAEKSVSPVIIPRYSPTDPNNFGSCSTTLKRWERNGENPCEPGPTIHRGPRTPPSPRDSVHYDPITPARPDPNEIIFKDSNDNHTKEPTPVSQKKQLSEKRINDDRGHYKKQPLLPEFKIPRMSNQARRYPNMDSNVSRGIRGRGRGNNFFNRGRGVRGRGRWENLQMYRQRPLPHAYELEGRRYYRKDEQLAFRSQERHCYKPVVDRVQQVYDPSVVLRGNAYDAAVVKHAYEAMGVPPEYFMHYQQVYVPTFPPPPPLPDEPPPLPPPPPPPPK